MNFQKYFASLVFLFYHRISKQIRNRSLELIKFLIEIKIVSVKLLKTLQNLY